MAAIATARPSGLTNGARSPAAEAPTPMHESIAATQSGHFGTSAAARSAPSDVAPRAASALRLLIVLIAEA